MAGFRPGEQEASHKPDTGEQEAGQERCDAHMRRARPKPLGKTPVPRALIAICAASTEGQISGKFGSSNYCEPKEIRLTAIASPKKRGAAG